MLVYQTAIKNRFHIYEAYSKIIDAHGHDFLEFAYVKKGAMLHTYNDGESELAEEGDFYIVDYDSVHSYETIDGKPLTVINFLFYPDFIERMLSGHKNFDVILNTYALRFSHNTLKSSPTGRVFHDEDGVIGKIVEDIVREYDSKNYGYLEYIRCRLVEALIHTMRKVGCFTEQSDYNDEVTDIINYVKTHYAENIRLGDIADRYNYSLSSISKKFKSETGVGFSKYIQRIRIEQSCRLLEKTELPVNVIAMKVGYDDVKFFRQAFKAAVQMSPMAYRKLTQNR